MPALSPRSSAPRERRSATHPRITRGPTRCKWKIRTETYCASAPIRRMNPSARSSICTAISGHHPRRSSLLRDSRPYFTQARDLPGEPPTDPERNSLPTRQPNPVAVRLRPHPRYPYLVIRRTNADLIVHALQSRGVRRLFGMPGGGSNADLIEAATRRSLPFTLAHTETASAFMACGQAEITGRRGPASRPWAPAPRP